MNEREKILPADTRGSSQASTIEQAAVAKGEERFRIMVNSAPVLIWTTDADAKLTFFNQGWLDFTGRSLEQLLNEQWVEAVHPDDIERCRDEYLNAFKNRKPFEIEHRLQSADRSYRWVSNRGVPRYNPDGTFAGYIGSAIDVTERREAVQELRRNQEKLSLALAAGKMGTWVWDRATDTVIWDRALEEIFGLEPDRFGGTFAAWASLLHPDEHDKVVELVNQAIVTHSSYDIEHRILRADGSVRWIEGRGEVYLGKDGTVAGTRGVVADVTRRKVAEEALRQSEERFRLIFEQSNDAMFVIDPVGDAILAVNPRAAELLGCARDELVTRRVSALHPMELSTLQALSKGPPGISHAWETELTCTVCTGAVVPVEVSATTIELDKRKCVIVTARDIRERKRQEQVLRFLAESSETLLSSLDPEEILKQVTRLTVPHLADWCTVHLVTEDGTVRRVAAAHADPAKEKIAKQIARRYPLKLTSSHPLLRVLATGCPEVHPSVSEEFLRTIARNDEHLKLLHLLNLHSVLLIPLKGRDQTFGIISFATAESGRIYDSDDLHLAEEVARRSALALENAHLYQERSHIARTLQRSLLPTRFPKIPGVEIEARYRPAGERIEGIEVGGDFYDVFATSEDSWAIVIGDVCGKGPEAAALTGLARHTLRAVARDLPTPTEVLGRLNFALLEQGDGERFCTVCYVEAKNDPEGMKFSVCCAGHPQPFVVRSNGAVEKVGSPGTLLGVFASLELTECPVNIGPGDTLIIYTDGVTESKEGTDDEQEFVIRLRKLAGLEAEHIAKELEAWRERTAQSRDDLALMVVRLVPTKERSLQRSIAPVPGSARDCRRALDELTGGLGLEIEIIETAKLLISEVVTNSVRHAGLDAEDRIDIDVDVRSDMLHIRVRDTGRGFSPVQSDPPIELRESGWGLQLVQHLATRWGVNSDDRTEVWFELDLRPYRGSSPSSKSA